MSGKSGQSPYDKALEIAMGDDFDHAQVYALLRQAHDAGDAQATYAIATWFLHATHVEKDLPEAVQYLTQAADAGIVESMYDLAVCYENGDGVEENAESAFEFYLRAARHGDDDAVFEVSRCYFWGVGVGQDRRIADIWADRAEALGVFKSEEPEAGAKILRVPGPKSRGYKT